ncbi:protein argonaute-2 isoform X2 [Drosophila albomicans]|uniref:Protein argonaute-2 isoform X1 n=1 Tax=Drosophila albomicans TaxID=7291 RepID=A0A6P8XJG8_DROAB|nr:protein argonaute-2 isoform X1 [Drosophila albomicans]XP_051860938.1 protein argonaute-2 isoform X2 [Drosophila albomicans]
MGKKNKYKNEPQEAAAPSQPQQPQQQQAAPARQGQRAEGGRDPERGWQAAGQQQQRQGQAQGGQGSQQEGWAQAGQQQRRPGAQQGGQAAQGGSQQAKPQSGQTPQQAVQQQQGPQSGQQGGQQGYQQRGPQGGQHGGSYQQRGPQGGQQGGQQGGGYQQRGPQGGQQGAGYQQRGQQGGQQGGGYQQRGPQGGQQSAGYQQRGPQGGQQGGQQGGGYQQRGPHGGQQGAGYQQRGPQGGQQGAQQGGGYQQRGPQGGQQGAGYQQRGPPPSAGSTAVQVPQDGPIKRGTLGRPGTCAVNYLDLDLSKMPDTAFHYDVTIVPDRPKKFYRQAFDVFRTQYLKNAIAAFDGRKSCYAVDKLTTPIDGKVEVIDRYGRTVHYTITIKETDNSVVDLSSLRSYMKDKIYDKPMRAMQCLEVVLAEPCNKNAIRAGRSFFMKSGNGPPVELRDGYEALVGLYQSFVLGDKPFVNVDVSHKSFPMSMPVIDYMVNHNRIRMDDIRSGSCNNNLWNVLSFLKGINIVYEPPKSFASTPRAYKVNGFSQQPPKMLKFESDGKVITVEEYFASRGYKLQYPNLYCLHVGPPAKNIYLPVELCRIEEGQALNRKDGANQVSAMIKFAATSTNVRKQKIMDLLKHFNHNADPSVSRFGIRITNDFITVASRLLMAPQLEYNGKNFQSPSNGSWYMNRCQFLKTHEKQHKWSIMDCDKSRIQYGKLEELASLVLQQSRNVNVRLEAKPDIRKFRDERHLDEQFKDLKSKNFDLVFVIIPNFGPQYEVIKQKAELQYGLLTQCIKQNSIERRLNAQLVDNVLLKVNSKLNGINHKIKDDPRIMLANVMYLGADVTHPSPDQRDIPSVVGVAGSHDPYGASYNMQYRLQTSGTGGAREEIEDMESIVTEHLRVYKQYRGTYPEHIIYYRDGVSDGQFMKIENIEIRAIEVACRKLQNNYTPKICCVIVVKRHHTRFFPVTAPHPRNKFNNVDPGTIIDRTIVHPNEMQFFMVSHQSIQGTAKPTRYNVIKNTGNLDIDLLQQLTYNLCHLFPRCNRSVSYPAPAYLAHLAAARGRVYIFNARLTRSLKEEYQKRLIVPAFLKSNPMYFV